MLVIMGDDEFIELRLESGLSEFRRRMRRIIKKVRMHVAAMARNPRTTMTAIAQWGKLESDLAGRTFPVSVGPNDTTDAEGAVASFVNVDVLDAAFTEAREADDKEAASEDEAIEATTESA